MGEEDNTLRKQEAAGGREWTTSSGTRDTLGICFFASENLLALVWQRLSLRSGEM